MGAMSITFCNKCGSEKVEFDIVWRDLELFGQHGVSVVGKEPEGFTWTCVECGHSVYRDKGSEVIWETRLPNGDDPEASIEAWEWWKAQEAHGNDMED